MAEAAAATLVSPVPRGERKTDEQRSYGNIVRSTTFIGGSSAINMVFGLLRSKAMALLLGPSGVGLLGLFGSIVDLTYSVAGLGLQNSGVRQIAESVGTGDPRRIARTAMVLNRTAVVTGLTGALLLMLFARPIAAFSFDSPDYAFAVGCLGFAVLLKALSDGQTAILQGLRRIADLARVNIFAAACSTAISIPVVYALGERGVVPSLVIVAAVVFVVSRWYGQQAMLEPVRVSFSETIAESAQLLKLGVAFMVSGLLSIGAAYAVRIIVLRSSGVEAAGMYQAAWALGGLYIGFILQAMGSDFYPRLTAVASDNEACNRVVNEQALISLLLAGPGMIATMTLAPLVIVTFYSSAFAPAVDILRWLCLGMMLRVVSWPLGFVIIAKGERALMVAGEVAAAVVHVGAAWFLVSHYGLPGAGAAFFLLYLWHAFLMYVVARRVSEFHWSARNIQVGLLFLPLIALVFAAAYVLPFWWAMGVGLVATTFSAVYSLRMLVGLVPPESIPDVVRQPLLRLAASR